MTEYEQNKENYTNGEERRKVSLFRVISGIIMVTIYLCMAFLLIFTNLFHNVPLWVRYVMGVVFFVYGIYRGYRVYIGSR